jgi:hypothetical protein
MRNLSITLHVRKISLRKPHMPVRECGELPSQPVASISASGPERGRHASPSQLGRWRSLGLQNLGSTMEISLKRMMMEGQYRNSSTNSCLPPRQPGRLIHLVEQLGFVRTVSR